jgi:curved DNA-binding protein CbpA
MGKDLYRILGVSREATADEIKKAYRKMALIWHPDKHAQSSEEERKAAEEKFKDIAQAFEVLSDAQQRAVYDQYGEEGLKSGPGCGTGADGMHGFPGAAGFQGSFPGGMQFVFSSNTPGGVGGMSGSRAEDIFSAFFAGGDPFGNEDGLPNLLGSMRQGRMRGRGGGHNAGSERRRDRCDELTVGTLVRLSGLQNAAHNGARGEVLGFDNEKHRYQIALSSGGIPVSIKPSNIQQVLSGVEIVHTSREDLNGRTAKDAYFETEKDRYILDGISPNSLLLRPGNVKLPCSTRVTIEGMQNRTDLNGVTGKILAADDERYTVQLQTGEHVRVRLDAVTPSLVPVRQV